MFETSTIRLSADETRLIVKAVQANGPISDYRACELANMGILRRVEKPVKLNLEEVQREQWKAIRTAVAGKDEDALRKALSVISAARDAVKRKEYGYVLTELGKQISRGITVKLNRQYTPKDKSC